MKNTQKKSDPIREQVTLTIQQLLRSLPPATKISKTRARTIIARYTAILEGNFIPWMAAAYVATSSKTVKEIAFNNLRDEISQNHPGMLRKFAISANSAPTDKDYLAVHSGIEKVRWFVGELQGVEILIMLAFFENFIALFMPYLDDLAKKRGSKEFEYTDVHGVLDISHSDELFRAAQAEMQMRKGYKVTYASFKGVKLLSHLLASVFA